MRKRGFTLLELMVSLAILSIFMLIVSSAFIQNYKITVRTESLDVIQNEYRNAVMNMENEIKSNSNLKVVVYGEGKVCNMEKNVGDVISNIKPLIYIRRTVGSSKSMILYALVENGTTKELQEILVQNIVSGDIEDENSISTFTFKPNDSKVLISSIDNVTTEIKVDEAEVINMYLEGVNVNNQKRSYPVSFTTKVLGETVIDIGESSITNSVDDFISQIGKNNINIYGNGGQSIKSTGNSIFSTTNGSLGFNNIHSQDIAELTKRGWIESKIVENKELTYIKYKSGSSASNITISNSINSKPVITNGTALVDNRIGTKSAIILVNGDVFFAGNLQLTNTVIISNGTIHFNKSSEITLTDSILYSKGIDIDAKSTVNINNIAGNDGEPKGILNDREVLQTLKTILDSNLELN